MNKVQIRLTKSSDAGGIAKVHVETWRYAYRGLIPDSYLNSLSIQKRTKGWKKYLKNLTAKVFPLVAVIDGEVVGWCTIGKSRDDDADNDTGELYGISVHRDHMGKGVGSKLMEKGLKILKDKGYKKATLWVLDTNENTRKWYESKMWKLDGTEKIEQRDGFDLHEIRYLINLK